MLGCMTNLDRDPDELLARPSGVCGPRVELFDAREVPLGGLRDTTVHRTLPQRELPTVGAWCFLDSFEPSAEAMRVLPHPHTGLQTVTWPVSGELRHRDSLGNDVMVRPGQLNLMTAGHGIAHSEFGTGDADLAGVQLWAALPGPMPSDGAAFQQVTALPVLTGDGAAVTVFVGSLSLGEQQATSPAVVHTALTGADADLHPGAQVTLGVDRGHEHAVLVLRGAVLIDGQQIDAGPLAYLGAGRQQITIESPPGARFLLIGGEPFAEDLVMFWNFVGRSHDEVAAARADWEEQTAAAADAVAGGAEFAEPGQTLRFGRVPGHGDDRIPAPQIPPVRLTPRRRRH